MKLLLADDHTLFRDALVQYIERAYEGASVTLAENFYQAFDHLKASQDYDLVLLDLRMPGMQGLSGFEQIQKNFPGLKLVLMSGVAEAKDVDEAIKLGAVGYFPKTLSGKALINAIKRVMAGEVFVPMKDLSDDPLPAYYDDSLKNKGGSDGMKDNEQDSYKGNVYKLTPRERDVLEYLITGSSNKEIAQALGLQVVTVKLHVRGICQKLDAKNRTQAALIAQENGIVEKASLGGTSN